MISKRIHLPLAVFMSLSICITGCRGGRALLRTAGHEVSAAERELPTVIRELEQGAKSSVRASEGESKVAIWAYDAYRGHPSSYRSKEFLSIHRPYKSVGIFEVLPDDPREFRQIYKRNPTIPELHNLERTKDKYRVLLEGTAIRVRNKGSMKESFIKHLEESDVENTFVIGHNEDGRFYFSNGDSLTLTEMVDLSKKHNKRCIYLSCEAGKHITTPLATLSELTHDEAIDIVSRIMNLLEKNDEILLKLEAEAILAGKSPYLTREAYMVYTVKTAVEESNNNANIKRVVRWIFTGSAGIGVGVFLIAVSKKE